MPEIKLFKIKLIYYKYKKVYAKRLDHKISQFTNTGVGFGSKQLCE